MKLSELDAIKVKLTRDLQTLRGISRRELRLIDGFHENLIIILIYLSEALSLK